MNPWRHDIQGRVTAKITPNGDTTTYQFYPVSGRLSAVTLPKDQALVAATFTLKYDALGRLVKQDFTDAATPDVSYTAFDAFSRLKEMTDGLGTTALSYHSFGQVGGGQLSVLDGPLGDDALRYSFTHFGRALRTENVSEPVTGGSAVRQFVEHGYDFMGRASAVSTDMGGSAVGYLSTNFTGKADSITHQVGGVDAVRSSYGYFPAANTTQHGRLQSITHAFPAGGGAWTMQAQHDYAYDVAGRLNSWRWQSAAFGAEAAVDRRWETRHDAADQLEQVLSFSGTGSTVLETWGYAYDAAGNRSYEEHGGTGIISKSGLANRLKQRGGAGAVRVSGTVDKAASVTVNGQPARVTSTGGAAPFRFETDLTVGTGTQTFSIAADDGTNPATTQSYSIDVPAAHQTYEHDLNGNLLTVRDGQTSTLQRGYEWDAANRLVKIVYADGGSTTFQYDGLSQRRVITERDAGGTITSTTHLLWHAGRVWQEQDTTGRVTKRYHFNGVQTLTYTGANTTPDTITNALTLTDHLGSHREVVTLNGGTPAITGRRDFDPYGKATQVGTVPTNAAYTSHYLHSRSGLELALYRAYDAELGRWLNEDPLGEEGGMNLYGYVGNGPLGAVDRLGLAGMEFVYDSPDAAAKAVFQELLSQTQQAGTPEWGGLILSNYKGKFAYTCPASNGKTAVNELSAPVPEIFLKAKKFVDLFEPVGEYHTHPQVTGAISNEVTMNNLRNARFSMDDYNGGHTRGLANSYLGLPNGMVKCMDPRKKLVKFDLKYGTWGVPDSFTRIVK
jgi:RHS repeat-associated protein